MSTEHCIPVYSTISLSSFRIPEMDKKDLKYYVRQGNILTKVVLLYYAIDLCQKRIYWPASSVPYCLILLALCLSIFHLASATSFNSAEGKNGTKDYSLMIEINFWLHSELLCR